MVNTAGRDEEYYSDWRWVSSELEQSAQPGTVPQYWLKTCEVFSFHL